MGFREISDWAGVLALLLLCAAATLRASRLLRSHLHAVSRLAKEREIRTDVSRVALPVVVTDRLGQFVSGLKPEDFLVFENGKRQVISAFGNEHLPMTVGLVIDSSESMSAKRGEVRAVAISFVESSSPEDEIFVVNFNERDSLNLPPSVFFPTNVDQLEATLAKYHPEGETALYDAIFLAMKQLKMGIRVRKSLLVISDGDDNASRTSSQQVLAAAERNSVLIYVLVIQDKDSIDTNGAFLNQLAEVTGGKAHFTACRNEVSSIGRQIAREMREQYTLVYWPSHVGHNGVFRTIRVVAQTPAQGKLLVRTRASYLAQQDTVANL
jgi:Ca-activated chloride channel homolog